MVWVSNPRRVSSKSEADTTETTTVRPYRADTDASQIRILQLETQLADVKNEWKEFETLKELELQDLRLANHQAKSNRFDEDQFLMELRDEMTNLKALGWRGTVKDITRLVSDQRDAPKNEAFNKKLGQKLVKAQQIAREQNKALESSKTQLHELEGHFKEACNELRRAENECNLAKHSNRKLKEEVALLKDDRKYRKSENIMTKFLHESTPRQTKNKLLEATQKLQRALDILHADGGCPGNIPFMMSRLKEEIEGVLEQNASLESKTTHLVKVVRQQACDHVHDAQTPTKTSISRSGARSRNRSPSHRTSISRSDNRSAVDSKYEPSMRTEMRSLRSETQTAWEDERDGKQKGRDTAFSRTPRKPFSCIS